MDGGDRMARIEAMLAESPDDPELRYMLAMEQAGRGDDAAAARTFAALIAAVPTYPPAYHMAGRTLARLGRVADARAVLERGIPVAQAQGNGHAAGEMAELLASLQEG